MHMTHRTRYGSTRTSDAQRGLRVGPAALALAAMALLVVGASLLFNDAPAALEVAQKSSTPALDGFYKRRTECARDAHAQTLHCSGARVCAWHCGRPRGAS